MLSNKQKWIDAIRLMRIPFSIFLMPIYWFALSDASVHPDENIVKCGVIFLVLHILVYPASNGYNSYCDKDEDSIGGLEKPPAVNIQLYYLVLLFDVLSIVVSLYVSLYFAVAMVVYLMVSKAYSYDKIRLKKYPVVSTVVVTGFQGFFVYLAIILGLGYKITDLNIYNFLYAVVATLFLVGSYPITQIYQHDSDAKRGDKTISRTLGINGTFYFSAVFFSIATGLYCYAKLMQGNYTQVWTYLVISFPIIMYFGWWYLASQKDRSVINFKNTMTMNKISSLSMSLIFIVNLFV